MKISDLINKIAHLVNHVGLNPCAGSILWWQIGSESENSVATYSLIVFRRL